MRKELVEVVLRALSVHGLRAVPAFPGQQLPILAEPLAAVGLESRNVKRLPHGIFYEQQTVFVDLYVSYRVGVQRCEEAAQAVENAFLEGLTDYSILSIHSGEMRHDAPSDCYRLRLRAEVASYHEEGEV